MFWVQQAAFVVTALNYVLAMLVIIEEERGAAGDPEWDYRLGVFMIFLQVLAFSLFFAGAVLCVWMMRQSMDSDTDAEDQRGGVSSVVARRRSSMALDKAETKGITRVYPSRADTRQAPELKLQKNMQGSQVQMEILASDSGANTAGKDQKQATKPSKIVPVSHLPTPEDRPPRPGRGQKESKVLDAEGGLAQSAADDLTTGAGTEQKNGATSRSPAAPGLEVQLKTKPKPAHEPTPTPKTKPKTKSKTKTAAPGETKAPAGSPVPLPATEGGAVSVDAAPVHVPSPTQRRARAVSVDVAPVHVPSPTQRRARAASVDVAQVHVPSPTQRRAQRHATRSTTIRGGHVHHAAL